MRIIALSIPGAFQIDIDRYEDERGYFVRTFDADIFKAKGLIGDFVQHSLSFNKRKGTLRGLHYQASPYVETKLVGCISGAAFDVLVDLRRSSPTFGRWHGVNISADNGTLVYIPAGCAHGFQTLADDTRLTYAITPSFVAEAARGIAFDDPAIGINWPLPPSVISANDRARPTLDGATMFP